VKLLHRKGLVSERDCANVGGISRCGIESCPETRDVGCAKVSASSIVLGRGTCQGAIRQVGDFEFPARC